MEQLITKIRVEIGLGRVPTGDVLRLCDKAEDLLEMSLKMERIIHDQIKLMEQAEALAESS
jgi:hypothetical protein